MCSLQARARRSTRRTKSTPTSSRCSSRQGCHQYAGMISGTRTPLCCCPRHSPNLCSEVARTRVGATNPRPLHSLDTLDGSYDRRGYGGGVGLATAANPRTSLPRSSLFSSHLQGKRRADERTRTADLVSLRVIHQALQWVHVLANPASLRGFLCSGLLRVAPYCVPGGVRVVSGIRSNIPLIIKSFSQGAERLPCIQCSRHSAARSYDRFGCS